MTAKRFAWRWVNAAPVLGLLLLSLLWALNALRADLLPNLVPGLMPRLERQAIPFVLLAVVAGLSAMVRRAQWPRGRQFWISVLIGLGLFVIPAGLLYTADRSVNGFARTALFTLVPVFTLVFGPYIGSTSGLQSRGGLLAALAGVAGALRVFPVEMPETVEAGWRSCAVILAAACVAAIAGAAATVALAGASACTERAMWHWDALLPELLWSAVVELPALLLLFWLMRRISAERMATRFLIAPLMAILIGAVLLRSTLTWRTSLGLLVMAAAGYLLLSQEAENEPTGLSLR